MRELPPSGSFDAVIGRLVLMYVADPVVAVRSLLRHLKPGGVIAFAEYNLIGDSVGFWPDLPLWRQCTRWIQSVPAGTGLEFAMGWKLHRTFTSAGLPGPRMSLESPLQSAADGTASFILAETMRSMSPLFVKLGIATETEIGIATLRDRLQSEAVAAGAVIKLPELVGAWACRPWRERHVERNPFVYDAIIVGARCAGAPTALLLARLGARVLLVDRARFPSDTISGHGILAPGVECPHRWGCSTR